MKYTSAEANKLVKKIEEKIRMLLVAESKASVFNAAAGEDVEALRPEYSFAQTQAALEDLQAKLRTVKHAINSFNLSHTLPGFKDITIDQALVLIPQLNSRRSDLSQMMSRLPRERVTNFARTNIIDYTIINYDLKEVEKKYAETDERLTALQLALDSVNSTETMEIDVTIE